MGGLREEGDSDSRRMVARSVPGRMNFSSGRAQLAPQVPEQGGRLANVLHGKSLLPHCSLYMGNPQREERTDNEFITLCKHVLTEIKYFIHKIRTQAYLHIFKKRILQNQKMKSF